MRRHFLIVVVMLLSLVIGRSISANAISVCVVSGGIVIQNVAGIEDRIRIEVFHGDQLVATSTDWIPFSIPNTALFRLPTGMFTEDARYQVVLNGSVTDRGSLFNVVRRGGDDQSVDNCIGGRIGDGRINDGGDQLAAPMAGYCTDANGIEIWDIDLKGVGTFDLEVEADEISNALTSAVANGVNQLIGTGTLGNQLWALSNGQLQFHAPGLPGEESKLYDFVFAGDTCS